MDFNYELISKIEAHVLIILSMGLIGIRYFFYDLTTQRKKYGFGHILILMFFTIFTLELLIVMIAFYFYYDLIDIAVISNDVLTYYIFIPKFIFYSTLCYFIYWLLKLFQHQNSILSEESELVNPEQLLITFMKMDEFKSGYLLREIRYKDMIIWKGILNGSSDTFDERQIGEYIVLDEIDD